MLEKLKEELVELHLELPNAAAISRCGREAT
jgi:hypothetical protein